MIDFWHLYKDSIFVFQQTTKPDFEFAIVTAYNPKGCRLTKQENQLRDRSLQQDIIATGSVFRSVMGCSSDLAYFEKSWLIAVEKSVASQLAEKYQQNAFYWVKNDDLFLVPCLLDNEEELLCNFSTRVMVDRADYFYEGSLDKSVFINGC